MTEQPPASLTSSPLTPARQKHSDMDAGAQVLSGQLGKTVQRLRKAFNMSLSDLSEQSGVAKSIISQIERNETNPTLATVWRLSQALDIPIDQVLSAENDDPFIEKSTRADTPVLFSEDGKMRLAIVGWLKTIDWLQIYDVVAEPGAVLESEGHPRGSIEHLTVLEGSFSVRVGGETYTATTGETLRYRCDRLHIVTYTGQTKGRATMVCTLKMLSNNEN